MRIQRPSMLWLRTNVRHNVSSAVVRRSPNNRTVLQQHVDFFDRDNDGIITPWVGVTLFGFQTHILIEFVPPLV